MIFIDSTPPKCAFLAREQSFQLSVLLKATRRRYPSHSSLIKSRGKLTSPVGTALLGECHGIECSPWCSGHRPIRRIIGDSILLKSENPTDNDLGVLLSIVLYETNHDSGRRDSGALSGDADMAGFAAPLRRREIRTRPSNATHLAPLHNQRAHSDRCVQEEHQWPCGPAARI